MMKYVITYTMKEGYPQGYHKELFKNKKEYEIWIKNNEHKIYWKQFRHLNAKSNLPRPIIKIKDLVGYKQYKGKLNTHFETGMECLGLVFVKDGIFGPKNPNFDPSKPESGNNFKFYSSYDALIFIESGQILEFPNEDGILLLKDRDFSKQDAYNLSYYPRGFTKKQWLTLFENEYRVTLWIKET